MRPAGAGWLESGSMHITFLNVMHMVMQMLFLDFRLGTRRGKSLENWIIPCHALISHLIRLFERPFASQMAHMTKSLGFSSVDRESILAEPNENEVFLVGRAASICVCV